MLLKFLLIAVYVTQSGSLQKNTHPSRVQIYHSSCQKNLFSCNINRLWVGSSEAWDLFLSREMTVFGSTSKTGHAVHIMKPQSQTNVLFKVLKSCLLRVCLFSLPFLAVLSLSLSLSLYLSLPPSLFQPRFDTDGCRLSGICSLLHSYHMLFTF